MMAGQFEIKLAAKRHPPPDPVLTRSLEAILAGGPAPWNAWRRENPDAYIDLRGLTLFEKVGLDADYSGINLGGANLSGSNFSRLNLSGADLSASYAQSARFDGTAFDRADLRGAFFDDCRFPLASFGAADLRGSAMGDCSMLMSSFGSSNLRKAELKSVTFVECSFDQAIVEEARFEECFFHDCSFNASRLRDASLRDCVLRRCSLVQANLQGSDLTGASLLASDFEGASLDGARVYGTSVWDCSLETTSQTDLLITEGEPVLTVDDLRIAQFMYLLLNNEQIKCIIDQISAKIVLILGRFTPTEKPTLDKLKVRLRELNYTPVLFDFEKSASRSYIETVGLLASMARFVIADLTNARVVLQEIAHIVQTCPSTPVVAVCRTDGAYPATAVDDFSNYRSFLPPIPYGSADELVGELEACVVQPAERLASEIVSRRQGYDDSIWRRSATSQT